MPLLYGKRPAREGAVKLKFSQFFSASQLPTPPLIFGRPNLITQWGMFANDQLSDCVFAGAGHETMLWNAVAGNKIPEFNDANIITAYESTGYTPGQPNTDQGSDMAEAAKYRQKIGIEDANGGTHKIDSYVELQPGNTDQLALAAYMFGAVGLGLRMTSNAMDQFDRAEPWSIVKGSSSDGGHYVPVCGRNSHGNFLIITWGRLQAVTEEFISERMDEGICYISSDYFKEGKTPRGFDAAALKAAQAQL